MVGIAMAPLVREIRNKGIRQAMTGRFLDTAPPKLALHIALVNIARVVGEAEKIKACHIDGVAVGVLHGAVVKWIAQGQIAVAVEIAE